MAVQVARQLAADYNLERFVKDVRGSIEHASTLPELLKQVQKHLRQLLANDRFLERDYGLPGAGEFRSRVLYKDPEYLFAVTASIQQPGHHTPPHDHGEAWAVYGVYRNAVQMTRYERLDDGSTPGYADLRLTARYQAQPGDIDVVLPFGIHETANITNQLSLAIVIRSRHLADIWRNRFDPERKTVKRIRGGGGD